MSACPIPESRRTPTDDELPALLEELDASGSSIAAFARERGLAVWKLYCARRAARSRSGRRKARKNGNLVPVHVVDSRTKPAPPLELRLHSGHRLLIPSDFDEVGLRRLMGVLASC